MRRLSVAANGDVIHRIIAATDPGYAVSPANQRQIAGSFVYGLSAVFYQSVRSGRPDRADQLRQLQLDADQ
jgi:hypothetical protein